jgi:excisionase family DNA binding protein
VTTTPDDVVGRLHDRMPLLLPATTWDRWLDPSAPVEEALDIARGAIVGGALDAYPVARLVNSVRNDGPELLAPADVAKVLGVSEQDVLSIIESGELTAKKIGSSFRVKRSALDEYLAR